MHLLLQINNLITQLLFNSKRTTAFTQQVYDIEDRKKKVSLGQIVIHIVITQIKVTDTKEKERLKHKLLK